MRGRACTSRNLNIYKRGIKNISHLLNDNDAEINAFIDKGSRERETREHTRIIILAREERLMIYIYI